jgi:hypothetical protein
MTDKELELEETEVSNPLGGPGEGHIYTGEREVERV